jgi:hypothetical protein
VLGIQKVPELVQHAIGVKDDGHKEIPPFALQQVQGRARAHLQELDAGP